MPWSSRMAGSGPGHSQTASVPAGPWTVRLAGTFQSVVGERLRHGRGCPPAVRSISVDAGVTAREPVAEELAVLAGSVRQQDAAVGELLGRLATAVRDGRADEVKAYAAALDPRSLAELITVRRSPVRAVLEVIRNAPAA